MNLDRSLGQIQNSLLRTLQGLAKGKAPWPLYLHGMAGTGKTRGCLAFLDHVPESRYVTVDQVVGETMSKNDYLTYKMLPEYQVVVVDEVGMRARSTEIDYQTVKKLADRREDQPMIWVSNASPAALVAAYDDRIASRLLCGTVFELCDQDRRMLKGRESNHG